MSTLRIFTESFTNRLKRSVLENLSRYQTSNSWVEEFATGTKWDLPTNVKAMIRDHKSLEELFIDPAPSELKDFENSVRLHKALLSLTPIQARDPRLWTRLTHIEFWAYMRKRWPIERYSADTKKTENYIESRYFICATDGRALLRNGLSRLWWYSYLTYDEGRDNPYELTAVLLKNLDITQQILERSMGRSNTVLVGFLEFLSENASLLNGGDENRNIIRSLAKSLNLFGGVVLLDCLTATAIKDQLANELNRLIVLRTGDDIQEDSFEQEIVLQNG